MTLIARAANPTARFAKLSSEVDHSRDEYQTYMIAFCTEILYHHCIADAGSSAAFSTAIEKLLTISKFILFFFQEKNFYYLKSINRLGRC